MEPVDVVISGIAGRFPQAKTMAELSEKLLQGKSLLEPAQRWNPGERDTPKKVAMTSECEKFDYTFFGMHSILANLTDPNTRLALELSFEALIDAGINPSSIRGKNVQIYAGITQFELDTSFELLANNNGYTIMGRNRCMVANRIAYTFNLCGRSCSYDGMCMWICDALQLARDSIQSGESDTAIIVGATLHSFSSSLRIRQLFGLTSPDSELHPFDEYVDGFGTGESQVAFVVQSADIAKRSYGSVILAGAQSQGTLPNWFLSVSEDHLRNYINSLYRKHGVDPAKVRILEADGLCNKKMVEAELNVLDEALNANRSKDNPLYLGSVKTMVGETEASGGQISLIKLILAMETGIISPTINYGKPNPNIRGLTEGRFKVVTEPTAWEVTPDTVVAVSSLSYNGVVGHVALKANSKTKNNNTINNYPLPYLVLISGRNEEIVEKSLKQVTSSPFDPEYLRLTQEVFAPTIDKYEWKGYGFHGLETPNKFPIQLQNRRPVWFVFSGMGSQWARCGKDLLLFPVVRETLERLHKILEPKGMDLMHIIAEAENSIFENILNSFVCITSIQIALTNLLFHLGIEPDGIIGHSVGELGCSYADGCLTEEQTILASYARGIASLKAELIPGLMAAVGMGASEVKKLLPPEVVVACRNSADSCTISGPTEQVTKVVNSFREKDIFVRQVNVSNIAYHSPYIKPAAPYLLSFLSEVITEPKLRSPKWICTSAPEEKWETDEVRYCSAEYQTNNLLSTVYFEEGSAHIPNNALCIEIAPHGLLQAILKRSLDEGIVNVPLTRRDANEPVKFVLEAIGKLYLEGLSPKIWILYPDVPMPVSRNTPSLVPLIAWEHGEDFKLIFNKQCDPLIYEISQFSPSIEIVGENCLIPAAILCAVWEGFTNQKRCEMNTMPAVFENVQFFGRVKLEVKGTLKLMSAFMNGTGEFETYVNDKIVAKGKVRILDDTLDMPLKKPEIEGVATICLESDDVYAEMRSRCIGVPEKMRSIDKLQIYPQDWVADVDFSDCDWRRLLNSLLIFCQLKNCEGSQSPAYIQHIRRLVINPPKEKLDRGVAQLNLPSSVLLFDGIELSYVSFKTLERPDQKLEPASMQFIPYCETSLKDEDKFLHYILQLALEKKFTPPSILKIYDFDNEHSALAQKIQRILSTNFSLCSEMTGNMGEASLVLCAPASIPSVSAFVAMENILALSQCGHNNRSALYDSLEAHGLRVLAECDTEEDWKSLVAIGSKLHSLDSSECEIIKMRPDDKIPLTVTSSSQRLIILVWENGSKKSPHNIFNEVLTMEGAEKIRLVFLLTPNAPPFSLDCRLYREQIRLNLPVNIYFNGKWGNYRSIPLPEPVRSSSTYIDIQPHTTSNGTSEMKIKYVGLNPAQRTAHEGVTKTIKGIWDYSGEGANKRKMMGLASFDSIYGCYVRDPSLVWTVPNGWTLEEAATVPCAYTFAYYALLEVAQLKPKDKIFITCPLTPVGQAALRIAFSLDCDISVLLASLQERDQLNKIFPKLSPTKVIILESDSLQAYIVKAFPRGVDVILSNFTGTMLRACSPCLGFSGKVIQINSEPMLARDYIGLYVFLRQMSVFGVSENSILNADLDVKKRVAEWVQNGIDNGTVCPNYLRQRYLSDQIQDAVDSLKANSVSKRIVSVETEKIGSKTGRNGINKSQSVILGGSKTQWIRLAHYLARNGKKNIVVVPEQPSSCLAARHAQLLRRECSADLKELTNVKTGVDLFNEATKFGTIESIFVFEHDKISDEVVREIERKCMKEIQMIFFSKELTMFTCMSERWVQDGFKVKATLGADDVPFDRITPLLDWLLSSASPTVSNLAGANFFIRKSDFAAFSEDNLLPVSVAELAELGAAIRGKPAPVVKEVVTRCTCAERTTEIRPLFYLKGIHGRAALDVKTIATDLLAPMFEVTLNETAENLETTAQAVADAVLKIGSKGPFNLAGDPIRSDLTLRVARVLEERGFASVVLLMDEHIDDIREELYVLEKGNKLTTSILKYCLSKNEVLVDWSTVDWSQLSWKEQVSTALSKINLDIEQRENVVTALEHIKLSMQHIIEAQDTVTLKHSILRSLKRGDDVRELIVGDRRYEHTIPASKLKNKDISDLLSAYLATPTLQQDIDRAKLKKAV